MLDPRVGRAAIEPYTHKVGPLLNSVPGGRDATLEFDDVGHSEEALALMVPMLVGTYEGGVPPKVAGQVVNVPAEKFPVRQPAASNSGMGRLMVPIVIILLTLAVRYFLL